jgi:hypothetical protein
VAQSAVAIVASVTQIGPLLRADRPQSAAGSGVGSPPRDAGAIVGSSEPPE